MRLHVALLDAVQEDAQEQRGSDDADGISNTRRSLAPKRRPPRENSRETAGQRARYRECVAKDKTPAPHRRKRVCSHDRRGRGVTRFAANMAAVKHERRCRAVQSKGAV